MAWRTQIPGRHNDRVGCPLLYILPTHTKTVSSISLDQAAPYDHGMGYGGMSYILLYILRLWCIVME